MSVCLPYRRKRAARTNLPQTLSTTALCVDLLRRPTFHAPTVVEPYNIGRSYIQAPTGHRVPFHFSPPASLSAPPRKTCILPAYMADADFCLPSVLETFLASRVVVTNFVSFVVHPHGDNRLFLRQWTEPMALGLTSLVTSDRSGARVFF